MIQIVYRQTYSVSLGGEIIGYTADKIALQKRINDYMSSGEGNVAFVEIQELPEYKSCMLKKNIETNDDEIFEKVKATGVAYHKYYAVAVDGQEKKYVNNLSEAEDAIQQLKDKNSNNASKLSVVEKYAVAKNDETVEVDRGTENIEWAIGKLPTYSSIEMTPVSDIVSELYVAKPVYTAYRNIGTVVQNGSVAPTDLGTTLMAPVSGMISSGYGLRRRDNHPGLDIAAPAGTPILASAPGTVIAAGYTQGYSGYGNIVVIKTSDALSIRYAHCSAVYVRVGQQVVQGQVIAAVGSTGISTGNHLHFEIRYYGQTVNPQKYLY